jgi:methyltransferase (TIGR00027 family)
MFSKRMFRNHLLSPYLAGRLLGWFLVLVGLASTAWGVNPGEPSSTAEGVTAYRAIAALAPDTRVRNPDHLAHKLVSREYWDKSPLSLDYETSKGFIDRYKVSVYYYINARTKHIDSILEQAAFDGTRQIVNLGAGYDSRALRFAARMPGVVFFELDLPATIAAKRARLLTFMQTIPEQVKLLQIDFNTQTLEQVLLDAGYRPDLKTLFIWEGVTYYISEAAVSGTLAFIATMSPPGSSVVFDYMPDAVVQKVYQQYPDARGPARRVAQLGEPWIFGISEGQAECYANRQGLQVFSILYPREMEARYLYRSDGTLDGRAPTYFRIMHAMVPPDNFRQILTARGCAPQVTSAAGGVPTTVNTPGQQTSPVSKAASAPATFTSIPGTWTGTDTLGGKLIFIFYADDTFTSKRIGGRDPSIKTGTYTLKGNTLKGHMEDITFDATMAGGKLNGSWKQSSSNVGADFTLAKKVPPESAREAEAVNRVLEKWKRYWNARDVSGIMTIVHAEARMMYGGTQQKMATYKDYPEILPGRMAVVGDCVLKRPVIQIRGNDAVVKSEQDTPVGYLPVTFLFKKENTDWKIIRFEYEL